MEWADSKGEEDAAWDHRETQVRQVQPHEELRGGPRDNQGTERTALRADNPSRGRQPDTQRDYRGAEAADREADEPEAIAQGKRKGYLAGVGLSQLAHTEERRWDSRAGIGEGRQPQDYWIVRAEVSRDAESQGIGNRVSQIIDRWNETERREKLFALKRNDRAVGAKRDRHLIVAGGKERTVEQTLQGEPGVKGQRDCGVQIEDPATARVKCLP